MGEKPIAMAGYCMSVRQHKSAISNLRKHQGIDPFIIPHILYTWHEWLKKWEGVRKLHAAKRFMAVILTARVP